MNGELVTAAAVLATSGAGTWFADKLFGPSAGAIGENLKLYLQSRIPVIFGIAGEKARARGVELAPIKPGLLAKMVVNASFSDENPEITEWWANLFVSAGHHSTNKHAVFAEMMAMIGPTEASCLREFIETFDYARSGDWFRKVPHERFPVELMRDHVIAGWIGETPVLEERQHEVLNNFLTGQLIWPLRPISWSLPSQNRDGAYQNIGHINPWFASNQEAIEILVTTDILKFERANVPVMGPSCWVNTVELTLLGAMFFAACRGYDTGA